MMTGGLYPVSRWQAFAAFGMGVGASSVDADVQGIVADNNVSRDLIA
jgi:hypothetical protein